MIEVRLPRSVRIAGTTYKIKSDTKTDRELDANHWSASALGYNRRISISTRSDPQTFSESFLHEILHRVDGHYNNDDLSEKEVGVLANGLHQVFEQLGVRFVRR